MQKTEQEIRQELDDQVAEARQQVDVATDLQALDAVRVRYLGKKGLLTQQLKQIGSLPVELRPEFGRSHTLQAVLSLRF